MAGSEGGVSFGNVGASDNDDHHQHSSASIDNLQVPKFSAKTSALFCALQKLFKKKRIPALALLCSALFREL